MPTTERIFFIHIPKTGGISIEHMLAGLTDHAICPAYVTDEFLRLEDATRYGIFQGHLKYFLRDFIQPDFTFTILRDPIERALSALEHIARDTNHVSHNDYLETPDIAGALHNPNLRPHITNAMTVFLGIRPELGKFKTPGRAARHAMLHQPMESMLESAKEALAAMDFVGFTETLNADQEYLHALLASQPQAAFQAITANQNPSKSVASYQAKLAPAELNALRAANALDLELYAYAQELADARGWRATPEEIARKRAQEKLIAELSQQPELPQLDFRFDCNPTGIGWHPLESDGDKSWCFTGPESQAHLYFPRIAAHATTLTLEVLHAVTLEHFKEFNVQLNGTLLEQRSYEGMRVHFAIPAGTLAASACTSIEILTPPPQRPDSHDSRQLGIAFSGCRIS